MPKQIKTLKRLPLSIAIIILLCICLAVTTFALFYSMVSVEDNRFVTGTVQINLNDGKPVISENEYLFEPGMMVKKDFFVQNESTCAVYYKVYFQNTSGGLADVLEVTICEGEKVLFCGTPNELNKNSISAVDDALGPNEKQELQIYFYFPESMMTKAQNRYLHFNLAVDAVQSANNTNKEFN